MPDELWDKKTCAEKICKSQRWIDRYIKKGLPYVQLGGTKRFVPSAVWTWINSNAGAQQ